jgi:hypothetical protein
MAANRALRRLERGWLLADAQAGVNRRLMERIRKLEAEIDKQDAVIANLERSLERTVLDYGRRDGA